MADAIRIELRQVLKKSLCYKSERQGVWRRFCSELFFLQAVSVVDSGRSDLRAAASAAGRASRLLPDCKEQVSNLEMAGPGSLPDQALDVFWRCRSARSGPELQI